jgi:type II secretory pathway pseudopilin PulG
MGTHKLAGFTIIETMLVVSISGLLVVGLLVGVSASLNEQRYRDATETFKSLLQQQYADLNNVQNGRDDNWQCSNTATAQPTGGPAAESRGQSDCVLLGKYLRIENSDISEYTVVGYKYNNSAQSNDVASLRNNYAMNVVKDLVDKSKMDWGTKIAYPRFEVDPVTGVQSAFGAPVSPRKVGILFVRSPDSGQIYTFTNKEPNVPNESNITPSTFTNLLVAGDSIPGQGSRTICIESNGLFTAANRAVYIGSYASAANAIEIRSNDYMASINAGLVC